MTDLIVALDGPKPCGLAAELYDLAGVRWFKVGPQAMMDRRWHNLVTAGSTRDHVRIFLDLKLTDTVATTYEAVKRFVDAGIAALSIDYERERTLQAALGAAAGADLRIWQWISPSDEEGDVEDDIDRIYDAKQNGAHGIIVPGHWLYDQTVREEFPEGDIVAVGIRQVESVTEGPIEVFGGHYAVGCPALCVSSGATHLVVGRPIYQDKNPIDAARTFLYNIRHAKG